MLAHNEEKKSAQDLVVTPEFNDYTKKINIINKLIGEAKFSEAQEKLNLLLENPKYQTLPPAYILRAQIYEKEAELIKKTDPDAALKLLTKAMEENAKTLKILPKHIGTLESRARIFLNVGRNSPNYKKKYADMLKEIGEHKKEKEKISKWHQEDVKLYAGNFETLPDSENSIQGLYALIDKQYICAHYYFELAVFKCPLDLFSWIHLAEAYFKSELFPRVETEKVGEIFKILDRLIKEYKYPLARALRGLIYLSDKNFSQARDDFTFCVNNFSFADIAFLSRFTHAIICGMNGLPITTELEKKELSAYKFYLQKSYDILSSKKYANPKTPASEKKALLEEAYLNTCIAILIIGNNNQNNLSDKNPTLAEAFNIRLGISIHLGNLQGAKGDLRLALQYGNNPLNYNKHFASVCKQRAVDFYKAKFFQIGQVCLEYAIQVYKEANFFIDIAELVLTNNQFELAEGYLRQAKDFTTQETPEYKRAEQALKKLERLKKENETNQTREGFEEYVDELIQRYSYFCDLLEHHQKPLPATFEEFNLEASFNAYKTKDVTVAIKYATEALNSCPLDYNCLTFRGSHLAYLGKYDEALQDLNQAIDNWEFYPAYWHRGLIYHLQGKEEEARKDLIKFVTHSGLESRDIFIIPKNIIYLILNITPPEEKPVAYDSKKNSPAEECKFTRDFDELKARLLSDPFNARTHVNLAILYLEEKNYTYAKIHFSLGIWFEKINLLTLYFERAKIYILEEDIFSAYADIEMFQEIQSEVFNMYCMDETETLNKLCLEEGDKAANQENYRDARCLYEAAFNLNKNDKEAKNKLINILELLDAEKALTSPTTDINLAETNNRKKNRRNKKPKTTPKTAPIISQKKKRSTHRIELNDDADSSSEAYWQLKEAEEKQKKANHDKRQRAQERKSQHAALFSPEKDGKDEITEDFPPLPVTQTPSPHLNSTPLKTPSPDLDEKAESPVLALETVTAVEEIISNFTSILAEVSKSENDIQKTSVIEEPASSSEIIPTTHEIKAEIQTPKIVTPEPEATKPIVSEKKADCPPPSLAVVIPEEKLPEPTQVSLSPKPALGSSFSFFNNIKPTLEEPTITSQYLRRFIPTKIKLNKKSLVAKIVSYLASKKLPPIYITGSAVTDWLMEKYFNHLTAEIEKNFSILLGGFIKRSMFDRARDHLPVKKIDLITSAPIADIETMAKELKLTSIPTQNANMRTYSFENARVVSLLNREDLQDLKQEVARHIHSTLFLCWDGKEKQDDTHLKFKVEDPSEQGLDDLALGRLRAVGDPEISYQKLSDILFTLYQKTSRGFTIDDRDEKIIRKKIPTLIINDFDVINNRLIKLFSYCHAIVNYQQLLDYKILDKFFFSHSSRYLQADHAWIMYQMEQINSFPHPNLKRIYAILLVSMAIQHLKNIPTQITVDKIIKNCHNNIEKFGLLKNCFAKPDNENLNVDQCLTLLITDWHNAHPGVLKGFFNAPKVSAQPQVMAQPQISAQIPLGIPPISNGPPYFFGYPPPTTPTYVSNQAQAPNPFPYLNGYTPYDHH